MSIGAKRLRVNAVYLQSKMKEDNYASQQKCRDPIQDS